MTSERKKKEISICIWNWSSMLIDHLWPRNTILTSQSIWGHKMLVWGYKMLICSHEIVISDHKILICSHEILFWGHKTQVKKRFVVTIYKFFVRSHVWGSVYNCIYVCFCEMLPLISLSHCWLSLQKKKRKAQQVRTGEVNKYLNSNGGGHRGRYKIKTYLFLHCSLSNRHSYCCSEANVFHRLEFWEGS